MASPKNSSPGDSAEHQAAAWLARQDRGLTAAEQDEYFQWLAEDPRHSEWIVLHWKTVRGLQLLAQWRPEHGSRPNPDLLAAPAADLPRRKPSMVSWVFPLGLAAAAAIAFLAWRPKAATMVSPTPGTGDSQTPFVELSPIIRKVLEDGSTIDLNRGAEVQVSYSVHRRDVRLVKGEASFSVARNHDRPFTVSAGNIQVRAVGTAFNVDLGAKTVEVLVTEGRVQVSQPKVAASAADQYPAPIVPALDAGQRAVVSLEADSAPQVDVVPSSEMTRALAWQPKQLEFNDTPLAEVVAEFNGANRVKMVVDDPELASVPVGASLRSDNVEGFVRLLEASFNVKAERRPDGVIVLHRAN